MYLQQTGLYSREGIEPVPGGAPDCERESSIPSLCKIWREGELFNGWGGRGYDDSVPGEVAKTTTSGDKTT